MKKIALALLGVVLTTSVALAESERIAVVDLQQVLKSAPHVEDITEKLKKQFGPREEKIRNMRESLDKEAEKLNKDSSVMSNKEKQALQDKIFVDRRNLQRMQQDFQDDLQLAQNKAFQQLAAQVSEVVKKVAKKEKYDLVLEKRLVPYSVDKLDVTRDVIKQMK